MPFVYEGFTQQQDIRCFRFRGPDLAGQDRTYCLLVPCLLFAHHHVPLQAGPQFCLQLLQAAGRTQSSELDRFRHYDVVAEDFQPWVQEKERVAACNAQKRARRKPFRRPFRGPQPKF